MNQKQKAEELFLNTEKTQKEIADAVGIDPKTLYRWMQQGQWRELKSATRRMPSVLVENIYAQLDDINYGIAQRERGNRHPTKDESLTINRLVNCIAKVKKQTSQGQNTEFLMNFINYVQPKNDVLAKTLTEYGSAFLNQTKVQGFHPYDIEYENENTCVSLSFGEGRGEAPLAQEHENQLELPFPEEDITNTVTSPSERSGEVAPPIGHESGIGNQHQNPTQQPENQQQEHQQVPTPMPENNFTPNRAATKIPLLATDQEPHRHPEFVSGTSHDMDQLASENSTLGRGQGDVALSKAPKPNKNSEIEIGYIGQRHEIEPGDAVMITLPQQDDPDIQRFSIGNAIYYVRKK